MDLQLSNRFKCTSVPALPPPGRIRNKPWVMCSCKQHIVSSDKIVEAKESKEQERTARVVSHRVKCVRSLSIGPFLT